MWLVGLLYVAIYWVQPVVGIALLLLTAVVAFVLRYRQIDRFLGPQDYLFLAYAALAFPASIYYGSYLSYARVVLLAWLIIFVFYNLDFRGLRGRLLMAVLLATSVVLTLLIAFGTADGGVQFTDATALAFRTYYFRGQSVGPTIVASLLSYSVVLLWAFWISNSKGGMWQIGGILALSVALAVSGGRSGMFATAVAIVTMTLLRSIVHRRLLLSRRVIFGTMLAVAATSGAVAVLSEAMPPAIANRFILDDLTSDPSAIGRITLWRSAVSYIQSNPAGLGFDFFYQHHGATTHNELLAQMVGAGIAGALAYVAILFHIGGKLLVGVLRGWGDLALMLAAVGAVCVTVIVGLAENYSISGNTTVYPVMWILAGAALSSRRCDKLGSSMAA